MVSLHKKTIYETLGRDSVHPFPARMAPGIALAVIAKAKRPLRVLDPMMGSGTVIALARFKKHKAIGLDIDPLAVLISRVWTTSVEAEGAKVKAREVLRAPRRFFRACRRERRTRQTQIVKPVDSWPIGLMDMLAGSSRPSQSR